MIYEKMEGSSETGLCIVLELDALDPIGLEIRLCKDHRETSVQSSTNFF